MIKVMHVITTLGPAGAETMLARVAAGMDRMRFENEVVSLTGIMDLAERMQANGTRVRTLGMKKGMPNPLLVIRLAKWIRESKPDVIHAWMYHANLVSALAARLAGDMPVVWGIHQTELTPGVHKRRTMIVNRVCAFLSMRLNGRIICCSEASMRVHQAMGYAAQKLEVIPNGFDTEHNKPDPAARASVRDELGLSADTPLIVLAARFHPQKDHLNFVRAAAGLRERIPNVHFALCGVGVTWENSQLVRWIREAGIRSCVHLLGIRRDVARLFAAADIATTTSVSGEAFPMVIGEAMACGTPCVVTDVGDSALIVGDTGEVVAPGDPVALAQEWRKLLEAGPEVRRGLGVAARRRVQQHFALPSIVERYQTVYAQLAAPPKGSLSAPKFSQCVP